MPLPEVAGAWRVFRGCVHQWAYQTVGVPTPAGPALTSVPTGIPAERVAAKARGYGVTAGAAFWELFEYLEAYALEALTDDRKGTRRE